MSDQAAVTRPGQPIEFKAGDGRWWRGASHGMHVNLRDEVDHDLVDVEFDREPGRIYLCRRDLLRPALALGDQPAPSQDQKHEPNGGVS